MTPYYREFGLERDPFLDVADPYFFFETGALRRAAERVLATVDETRGLAVVTGAAGCGKTSLSAVVEQRILQNDDIRFGKILDPSFLCEDEFLAGIGRLFGVFVSNRTGASLKNELKNFFFDNGVLESKTLALFVDEAEHLPPGGMEALRLLLNFHIPQKKLLNVVLFGPPSLRDRITGDERLADRVDTFVELEPLDDADARALLEFRLARAGAPAGRPIFAPSALEVVVSAGSGVPRRLLQVAHGSMSEAVARQSDSVLEEHARVALLQRPPPAPPVTGDAVNPHSERQSVLQRLLGAFGSR